MPLTRESALALAGLVVLAYGDAVPPGGTISQGAAAASPTGVGAAQALHKGSAAPKKVATAPGSAFYHKPIGALIIPHGKTHYTAGAPGHMIHSTSQAKWIANQWKDKDASGEAEKAVAEGTHHWVQAGEHTYAVHNGLETHVPKDVDIHDPAAVKNSHKVIVKPGDHPEHVMLKPEGPGEPQAADAGTKHLLYTGYKPLAPEPPKKAVTDQHGKHVAWVPHDWQVYKSVAGNGSVKFAKDPDGTWYHVDPHAVKDGLTTIGTGEQQDWVEDQLAKGSLEPDEHPGPEPSHVAPNQAAEGTEKPKADVGGVAVTKDQIHDAIQHLNEDKSTAVKQPLQKKGHPLAAMDYHQVAKDELAKHPELKVPAGTKKQHVGQVKVAVLHHLAAAADKLAQDEAQAKAAQEATAKAEAAASHAQQLAPGTVDIGGVTVSTEHLQDALAKLEGSASTQIKGLLKGNPLAASDYWKVVNDYNAAHPLNLGTGTKKAHVPKAKTAFVAALKEHLATLEAGDSGTGHTVAAALDEAVSAGVAKGLWSGSADGAIAHALVKAHEDGQTNYAYLIVSPGVWTATYISPEAGKAYYEVTPEHQVTLHFPDGTSHQYEPEHVLEIAKTWIGAPQPEVKAPEPEPAAPEPEPAAPEPEPEPEPVWDTAAWKQTPEYQTVHDLIANHPKGLPPHDNKLDTYQQLAAAMYMAAKMHKSYYLYPATDGGWTVTSSPNGKPPPGIAGSFAAPGKAYYEVTQNHEITAFGKDGQPVALAPEQIANLAQDYLTPPSAPEPDIPVTVEGNQVGTVPAGSKIYVHKGAAAEQENAPKQVKLPDGTWKTFYDKGTATETGAPGILEKDGYVKNGTWIPYQPGQAAEKPAEPPPPAPEPTAGEQNTEQLKQLLVNGAVKPADESGGKGNLDWITVTALAKAAKTGHDYWAANNYGGGWSTSAWDPGTGAEHIHVSPDLTVTHHLADGTQTVLSQQKITELASAMVVPDAVKLHDSYNGGFKVYKYGFYYKPSKAAKTYLEISAPQYAGGSPAFVYHAPSGTKTVNSHYAAKVLTDATEYHEQAKGTPSAGKKVAYAAVAEAGTYQLWSDVIKAPSPEHTAELHGDGSVLLHNPAAGATPISAESDPQTGLLKAGTLLDAYGTSVVKPGVVPEKYHLFGSEAKTKADLQDLLAKLQAAYSDKNAVSELVVAAFPDKSKALDFFHAKGVQPDWHTQRDAVIGLLNELLTVPEQKPGTAQAAGEVKYLKGLPPGIASAKDIFTWTDQGYAKPADVTWPAHGLAYDTATVLGTLIKQISAQYGDGKVVGTHPSALAKDAKLDWLQAWQAGDMAKVFAYDSSGGKVSPAHPGAPGNPDTHHVTWAPWDVSQVPAGQAIAGPWSPEGVPPPKAEVDNYLIKAGLTHAEWLTAKQRREWVQAHRGNDQLTVDSLTKQAANGFTSGAQPKSEPPTWTENLPPAKPWDAYIDEQAPAQQWPGAVLDAFIAAHPEELTPLLDQATAQLAIGGYDSYASMSDYYKQYYGGNIKKSAVQSYVDDVAAKAAAEKLKPKYHLTGPGAAEDQFGRQYEWITGSPADLARRAAVAALARAWGFRTPQLVAATTEDGQSGMVTPLLDHNGTLAGLTHQGMQLLMGRELGDIAREHVLDYALANPGSTPGAFLRLPDGSVLGADKMGALSDLGWDGADPSGMNAQAVQPVSLIFSAISQGWLPQEQADAAYTAAVRAARRMAGLSDARLSQALSAAGLDQHSISQLTDRKNTLPDQIQGLWDGVYAAKGWTPPEVPVAKLSRGLHSGFSEPEFMDHVAAAKSFGVPAFFNEPGLAGGHVLVWTELDPNGERQVRGEAAVRGHVLDKVTGWVKAHSGDSSTMVPKGEEELHNAIKTAAEVINTHAKDQIWSGPITASALAGMVNAKSKLTTMLADAQHAQTMGPSSGAYAQVAKDYGDPASVVSMAQHYLAQIDTAEHAKVSGAGGLTPDQFPTWQANEQTHVLGGGVKITYKKSKRELGTNASDVTAETWSLGKQDGELHLAAGKHADYPGYVWEVALPTGEKIEINDSGETQTPKAHTGMVRFTSVTADGNASLERIRSFLQQAGLPMEEADQAGMENLYWRTLGWVLGDRADRKAPEHLKVWDELAQGLYGKNAGEVIGPGKPVKYIGELTGKVITANMAPEEEAALWRKAWSHLTSPGQVQQWVDAEGYLPHLGHYDIHAPQVPGGKPDWYRFDVNPADMAKKQMLTESFYDDSADAALIARSGGLYSSDARLRALGTHKTGMSWGSDMGYGSSGTVFTRQNQQGHGTMGAWISPRALARVQTYTFPEDKFGQTDARRTHAYFNMDKATEHTMSSNEAMIMDAVSLLDDIEVLRAHTETQRQQIIADLKGAGLTEIRGLPVEDRIVTAGGVSAAVKKAAAAAIADGWFAQPENPFVPPPSALSGAPPAEKNFAQQVVAGQQKADAAADAAQVAAQLEQLAQQAGEVPFSYA